METQKIKNLESKALPLNHYQTFILKGLSAVFIGDDNELNRLC